MKNMFTLSKKEYNLIKVTIFIFTIFLVLPTFFVEKQIVFLVHVVYIPIVVGGLIIGKWYGLSVLKIINNYSK